MNLAFRFSLFLALAVQAMGAELPHDFQASGAEFSLYKKDSAQPLVNCKVEKISIDHRRLGFFHVRLMPVLVAQEVQIELLGAASGSDWLEDLQRNLAPGIDRQAVEWREVDFVFQRTNHLRAKIVRKADGRGPAICRLESVSITAAGGQWSAPKADLVASAGALQAVWKTADGQAMTCDLSGGKVFVANKMNEEFHEK